MGTPAWLTPAFVRRLEALQLSVRWVRAGTRLGGRFAINRRGSSIEFADYVPYHAGDDIRAIDWNLYARLNRLYVKTYKEEIQLTVELMIDATASMGLPTPQKFERAKQLALCVGYVALAGGHHVRVSWLRPGRISASPWFHQRSALGQLADAMAAGTVGGRLEHGEWARRAGAVLRMRGGQAILMTDGMTPPADFFRALQTLAMRHLELKVVQVLTPQELRPGAWFHRGAVVDAETGTTRELAYSAEELNRAVADHNELLARCCKRNGIPYARHRLDEGLESCLVNTRPASGFLKSS